MRKIVTLGQFLDLIDSNRESEEHINIMNGNGEVLVRGMVCYDAWEENRLINSIGINKDCEYEVWLEPREGDNNSRDKYTCPNCGGNLMGKPLICATCGYEQKEGE